LYNLAEHKRSEDALHQYAERLRILHEMDRAILAAQSPEAIAQAALRHIRRLVPSPRASVALFDLEAREATVLVADVESETAVGAGVRVGLDTFGDIQSLRQGKIHVMEDTRAWPQPSPLIQALEANGVRSYINVPLVARGQLIGCLNLGAHRPGAFTPEQVNIVREVADSLAVAIENARLFDETRRRAAHQEALNAMIAAAAAALDLYELLEMALDHTLQALGLEMGAIWLFDTPGAPAPFWVVRGFPSESEREIGLAVAQVVQAAGMGVGEAQAVEDWGTADGRQSGLAAVMARFGIRASLTVPIVANGRRIGGLSVAAPEPRPWPAEEIALVEAVGRQVGAAAQRLHLLAQTQEQARRVQQILDTVPDGVLLLDPDHRILMANPVAQEYLAVLADVGVGTPSPTWPGGPLKNCCNLLLRG
jgi:GAF domain-containing protein